MKNPWKLIWWWGWWRPQWRLKPGLFGYSWDNWAGWQRLPNGKFAMVWFGPVRLYREWWHYK